MDKKKVLVSWSGGKDSMLVLHKLLNDEQYEVVGLLTNLYEQSRMVTMHFIPESIIQKQADALNLPVFTVLLPINADNETFQKRTIQALENEPVDAIAFGDIFLEDIKAYREKLCGQAGFEAIFPLWGTDPKSIAKEFMEEGFSAIIICLEEGGLDESWLGHVYNQELIDFLPSTIDEAGEQGHFHTMVIEGPGFQQPVEVVINGKKHMTLHGADMNKFIYCTFKV